MPDGSTPRAAQVTRDLASIAMSRIREAVAEHRKPTLRLGMCGLVLHHVPVLREASLLYPKDIDRQSLSVAHRR
jgi:hypothetical protein